MYALSKGNIGRTGWSLNRGYIAVHRMNRGKFLLLWLADVVVFSRGETRGEKVKRALYCGDILRSRFLWEYARTRSWGGKLSEGKSFDEVLCVPIFFYCLHFFFQHHIIDGLREGSHKLFAFRMRLSSRLYLRSCNHGIVTNV